MLLYDISQTLNKSSQSPTWRVPIGSIAINPYNISCGDVSLEDATPTCFPTELHVALVLVQPVNHRCDQ